ncbi:unnamed protein product [Sphagnum troendelagicum]|uniref:Uncharacterized protein n=1 Tax=Sphagnum troendelagicum TaxID=128251 RepID=A0ABP0V4Q2_9BRYO
MAHSLLGAECYFSVSAVLVRSSSSLIAELSSPTSEVLNSINKVQIEVVWQISMLDDIKSDMEEVMEGLSCSTTLSANDYLHQAHRDQAANAATLTPMGMDEATCVPCRKCLALILRLANVAEPSTATELANPILVTILVRACCFSQVPMPGQGCLVDLQHVGSKQSC